MFDFIANLFKPKAQPKVAVKVTSSTFKKGVVKTKKKPIYRPTKPTTTVTHDVNSTTYSLNTNINLHSHTYRDSDSGPSGHTSSSDSGSYSSSSCSGGGSCGGGCD